MTRFLNKLFGKTETVRKAPARTRPRLALEELAERANPATSYAAMSIAGQGVFVHTSAGAWVHPTTSEASLVAVNGNGQVAMEIPGQGVSVYNCATGAWQHPTGANVSGLDIDQAGRVAMEIPGQGVFVYNTANNTWQHPTTSNASEVAIGGGKVAMEVQGQGVSVYNTANDTWQHPTAANASSLDIDEAGDVAMEIPGQGVWVYQASSTWQHPTAVDAKEVAIAGGNVAMEIPGQGVFEYNLGSKAWQHPNTTDAAHVALDDMGELLTSCGGVAVNGAQITAATATVVDIASPALQGAGGFAAVPIGSLINPGSASPVSHDFLGGTRSYPAGMPGVMDLYQNGNLLTINWTGQGHHDKYLLRYSVNGGAETQLEYAAGYNGSFTLPVTRGSTYTFKIEWGDRSGLLGTDWSYSGWTQTSVTAL